MNPICETVRPKPGNGVVESIHRHASVSFKVAGGGYSYRLQLDLNSVVFVVYFLDAMKWDVCTYRRARLWSYKKRAWLFRFEKFEKK